jgi:hypothetical protein
MGQLAQLLIDEREQLLKGFSTTPTQLVEQSVHRSLTVGCHAQAPPRDD